MTKLASLIMQEEGYGVPNKIPTRRNNPGDLRHSPHSSHVGIGKDDIGIIPTFELGLEDLERQLQLYAKRNMTLRESIYEFAPPNENNSARYLNAICRGLNCSPDLPISEALKYETHG